MQFEEARYFPGTAPIDAYGNGGFRFAEMSHKGSILCLPGSIRAWRPEAADDIRESDFREVFEIAGKPELLLLGTGADHRPMPESLRRLFRSERVRFDVMSTGAAARTYNVLLGEGRSVGAALIAVD